MRKFLVQLFLVWLVVSGSVLQAASNAPDFKEVRDLIRAHAGVDEAALNRAAVEGLLAKLSSQAWLLDSSHDSVVDSNAVPITSSAIFDDHYGYVRIARINALLPAEFSTRLNSLAATNRLKGLVVDLRYAIGTDYDAAARVADRFFASEQMLIDWGQGQARSTDKTNAFRQPVAILVNHFTTGAAEALAAVLRSKDVGLLIGTNTAGQASITKDFPLQTGQSLRLAVAPVKIGDGQVVKALKPDIRVDVSPEDERVFFLDAYQTLPRNDATSSTNVASLSVTNRPRRRLNEAELVRMLREGETPEEEGAPARPPEPARPTITDPSLARAIDLLTALAVVRHTRL